MRYSRVYWTLPLVACATSAPTFPYHVLQEKRSHHQHHSQSCSPAGRKDSRRNHPVTVTAVVDLSSEATHEAESSDYSPTPASGQSLVNTQLHADTILLCEHSPSEAGQHRLRCCANYITHYVIVDTNTRHCVNMKRSKQLQMWHVLLQLQCVQFR